jgi:diguanylate cyclase (GGDEF)-like protein
MSGWGWKWLLLLGIVLALTAFAPSPASAEHGRLGQPLAVCVLPATPGMTAQTLLRTPNRFDCKTSQYDLGAGDYWALSAPFTARSTAEAPLHVRFASLWQQRATITALYADGATRSATFDGHGTTARVQLGAILEQPLPVRDAPVVRLLWHVERASNVRGIVLDVRLFTAAQSAESNLALGAIYAAFAGLCIALLVYNFALWGALRHRFQLAYCAMVFGLLLYAFSSSGVLAWAFPGILNNDRLRINHLLLAASASASLVFARAFFEERIFAGLFGRWIRVAAVAVLGAGIGFAVIAPFDIVFADRLYSITLLCLPCVAVPLLWRAWRLRANFLWLFALSWAAPIGLAFARILANLHWIESSFWLDNSTIVGMALEALLSSIAIAYRIRMLTLERDAARAGETIARRLAEIDSLTNLLNRRAFLEKAIGRPGTQTLLIADLDHFKQVNETLGHDGGDEVLRVFARTLRASVPAGALIARIGGEEFAILTAADDPVEGEAVLARLRDARMPFDLPVTASIGACSGPIATDVDWKALYRGADAALYRAKSAGRDRARDAGHLSAAA